MRLSLKELFPKTFRQTLQPRSLNSGYGIVLNDIEFEETTGQTSRQMVTFALTPTVPCRSLLGNDVQYVAPNSCTIDSPCTDPGLRYI
jgi:hypothetical protein